jgi:D-alanyl-D-alanine carboxypeptidase (penicillin-binding protein 5/6)
VTVTEVAADIRGTNANLEAGDILTIEQLLYGLMLPSGNDAAFALAQYFGKLLFRKKYTRADITRIRSY